MKHVFIAVAAVMFVVCSFICCGNDDVDPVNGTTPVDTTFWSGVPTTSSSQVSDTRFPLDQFKTLGEKNDTTGQRKMINKYRKQLTINVINHYPKIKDQKNIRFILGSGFAKNVKSGDGKTYSGKFRNELIIIINDPHIKDTLFLACGNGMLRPLEFSSQYDFGTAEQWRFEIQKGEGLATYLPQLKEWSEVANQLSIPIKNSEGKVVGKEIFTNYLGKYESLLFTGDIIDLIEGTVYKDGQQVDFDRRRAETKKANDKIAKAKAARAKVKSKKSTSKGKKKRK